jgi:hypothetical protein
LFGGRDGAVEFADTWEWDGQTWAPKTPATSPAARWGHALAYDAARQRVVLFGGRNVLSTPFGDTWEWDGVSWIQRTPASRPIARSFHAMTYDVVRQRVVLFGGQDAALGRLGDTWEWDGTNWVQATAATSPPPRHSHAVAYDLARQRVVLFAGYGNTTGVGLYGETWEWDGVNWVRKHSPSNPPPRNRHALAYNVARQRVVLFGGQGASSSFDDTWEWDGSNWAQLTSAARPQVQELHALAYDALRQRVVLFGGYFHDETWLHGDLVPAAALSVGSACAGSNGLPVLTSTLPFLGNQAFLLELLGARPLAPCLFVLAADTQALQLGGGCTLYLKGSLLPLVALTNARGFASLRIAVPFDVSWRGASVYAQSVVVDPLAPFAGLALSAGRKLVLGD